MTDAKVYRAIVRFINEHKYSPSYKELCELAGIRSTATICYAVQRLEEKGFIARTSKRGNRNIVLTKAHPDCDVVEVRHGRWVEYECEETYGCDDAKVWYRCSVCEKDAYGRCPEDEWYSYPLLSNYCPHCGTKMDGEVADNG